MMMDSYGPATEEKVEVKCGSCGSGNIIFIDIDTEEMRPDECWDCAEPITELNIAG